MSKALLLVDHGSMRSEANEMLEGVADLVRELAPNLIVKIAHMELAAPSIAEGFRACVEAGASEVIVHPYMLSPGRHATQDVPRMVEEAAQEFPEVEFRTTEPLGLDSQIAAVVLRRAGIE